MNIFDYLKNVTEIKEPLDFTEEEVNKGYDIRMMNRYISMCDMYVPYVNEINKFSNIINKNAHYRYFFNILPKRKQFFSYIKKDKDFDNIKKMIAIYFDIGMKEVDYYIKFLNEDDLQKVIDSFNYGSGNKSVIEV